MMQIETNVPPFGMYGKVLSINSYADMIKTNHSTVCNGTINKCARAVISRMNTALVEMKSFLVHSGRHGTDLRRLLAVGWPLFQIGWAAAADAVAMTEESATTDGGQTVTTVGFH